jgi:N-methylhydantoinase B
MEIRVWAEQAHVSGRGLRHTLRAPGLFGGKGGRLAAYVLHAGSNRGEQLQAVFSERPLPPNAVLRVETPSGGGFGDPLERAPALVLADAIAGKVSRDGAARDYGVVLADDEVDVERTAVLRHCLAQERHQP